MYLHKLNMEILIDCTSPCRDRTFDLFISKLVMEAEGIIWSQLYLNVNKCSWFSGVKLNGIKVMYCVEKFKIHNVHLSLLLKVNFQYSDARRRKGLLMAPLSHTWLCLLSVRQCS